MRRTFENGGTLRFCCLLSTYGCASWFTPTELKRPLPLPFTISCKMHYCQCIYIKYIIYTVCGLSSLMPYAFCSHPKVHNRCNLPLACARTSGVFTTVNFLGIADHSEIAEITRPVEPGFGNLGVDESWKVSEPAYGAYGPRALYEAAQRWRVLIKPNSSHRLGIVCGTTHD